MTILLTILQEERKECLSKMKRTGQPKASKEGDQYFASLLVSTKITSTENFSSVFSWKPNSRTNRYVSEDQLHVNNLGAV